MGLIDTLEILEIKKLAKETLQKVDCIMLDLSKLQAAMTQLTTDNASLIADNETLVNANQALQQQVATLTAELAAGAGITQDDIDAITATAVADDAADVAQIALDNPAPTTPAPVASSAPAPVASSAPVAAAIKPVSTAQQGPRQPAVSTERGGPKMITPTLASTPNHNAPEPKRTV